MRQPQAIPSEEEMRRPVTFKLPLPPSVNHYLQHVCERSTKEDPHRIKVFPTSQTIQYRESAGWLAKAAGVRMFDADTEVALRVDVYIKRLKDGSIPLRDLDNMLKMVQDSLIGIAFEDDKQVADIRCVRHFTVGRQRIEVTVRPITGESE